MQSRRGRQPRMGSSLMRALGSFVIILMFAGAAILLTYHQRAPDTDYAGHEPDQPSRSHDMVEPPKPPIQPEKPHEPPVEHALQPSDTQKAQAPQNPRAPQPVPASAKPRRPASASFRNEISRGSEASPRIALTFDAGWEYEPVPDILEALAKHKVRATFFLTGRWIEKNPELTSRIAAEGHEIGNHTYSHKRLTDLTAVEIAEEAEKTEQLALRLTGRSTKPLLRVPYGERDARVLSVLEEHGYRSVYWDVDSWDGYKKGITSGEIEQRVLSRVGNGSIVLMHCGSRATTNALDSILRNLIAEGYEPVTVGDLLR